jgi:hypothetical protein
MVQFTFVPSPGPRRDDPLAELPQDPNVAPGRTV